MFALDVEGGDLWAGGGFSQIPLGTPSPGLGTWNGSTWSSAGLGPGTATRAVVATPSGTVYAGGSFLETGRRMLAQWNGSSWSGVGADGTTDEVRAIVQSEGTLYIGGRFYAGGAPYVNFNKIAKWNGSAWSAVGTAWGSNYNQSVNALAVHGSVVYAGGDFTTGGGAPANYLAKWDGTSWSALGSGVDGTVNALDVDAAGNLYAGGHFTTAGGVTANRVAKWDGTSWSALGSGMDATVSALETVDYCGQSVLYAGGAFSDAGGALAQRVAAWDGAQWSPVGSGVGGQGGDVLALAASGPGTLYAGGSFLGAVLEPTYIGQAAVTNRACAPTAASAVSTAPEEALVSWTNPDPSTSPAWTDLVATASPGGRTCTTTGATSCTVTGLTNGTAYTFTVKAINTAGDSPPSNATGSVTPRGVPTVPTGATATAGPEQATVSWMAPASDEGSAIVGYTVTASPGGRTCTTTGATSCTVTGLTNGTAYTFTVRATNATGTSAASAASSAVTPAAAPTPPAPTPSATPSPAPPARPVVAALRTSVTVRGGVASTTGAVPPGATRIVQTATTGSTRTTQGFLEMARAKRATGTCTIKRRKYSCAIRLSRGTWTVTTTARGKAGVVAQGTRRVVVR